MSLIRRRTPREAGRSLRRALHCPTRSPPGGRLRGSSSRCRAGGSSEPSRRPCKRCCRCSLRRELHVRIDIVPPTVGTTAKAKDGATFWPDVVSKPFATAASTGSLSVGRVSELKQTESRRRRESALRLRRRKDHRACPKARRMAAAASSGAPVFSIVTSAFPR